MPQVVIANADKSARSAATPTWISLALGTLICLSLFVIAAVIVVSLIPVYLKSKTLTVATGSSVSNLLSSSYSTDLSGIDSQSVTNTEELAAAIATNAGLSANSLVLNSAAATGSGTGRRRRQGPAVSSNVPACNNNNDGTARLDMDLRANPAICSNRPAGSRRDSCMTNATQFIQTKLDDAPPLDLKLRLANGSEIQTKIRRCRADGAAGVGSTSCSSCRLTFDDGVNNFFVGDVSLSNTSVITPNTTANTTTYNNTDYVGYPTSAYSGTCGNLCASLGTLCASSYADCGNRGGARFDTCTINSRGSPCLGISIYADPNGNLGLGHGDPIACTGSTDYCCCIPRR